MGTWNVRWWVVLSICWGSLGASAPAPPVLRVRGLVLVDDRGAEVGRFVPTAGGAELVLGGESQASLVTDGEVAALNLSAAVPVLRTAPVTDGEEDEPVRLRRESAASPANTQPPAPPEALHEHPGSTGSSDAPVGRDSTAL